MTNFEKMKSISNVNDMSDFINNLPEFGYMDKCIIDCKNSGNCNNCISDYLNKEYDCKCPLCNSKMNITEDNKTGICTNKQCTLSFGYKLD
jgi:hypothetical protein